MNTRTTCEGFTPRMDHGVVWSSGYYYVDGSERVGRMMGPIPVPIVVQVGHTINNAQMAGVPGHPMWATFQRGIQAQVAAGKRWPLETTGPHLLTDVVRVS